MCQEEKIDALQLEVNTLACWTLCCCVDVLLVQVWPQDSSTTLCGRPAPCV